jgi:type VI protein secretion system component VasF
MTHVPAPPRTRRPQPQVAERDETPLVARHPVVDFLAGAALGLLAILFGASVILWLT